MKDKIKFWTGILIIGTFLVSIAAAFLLLPLWIWLGGGWTSTSNTVLSFTPDMVVGVALLSGFGIWCLST